MSDQWWLRTQDETFGPVSRSNLLEWAQMGRIQPGQEVSDDGVNWKSAVDVPFLDMRWSIDIGDGTPRGPFNRHAAQALLASGRLPRGSKMVEVAPEPAPEVESSRSEPSPAPRPQPAGTVPNEQVEKLRRQIEILQKGLDSAQARAADAERQIEDARSEAKEAVRAADAAKARLAMVQAEAEQNAAARDSALAEKQTALAEKDNALAERQTALAEKDSALAEKESALAEKDSAIAEKESAIAEKDSVLAEKQTVIAEKDSALAEKDRELEAAKQVASEAEAKAVEAECDLADLFSESKANEEEYEGRIKELSDEIKRMPPSAKLAADAQAAMYSLMCAESDDLAVAIEAEGKELEALRKWREQRLERLLARRQEILRRLGTDAEDMARRAQKAYPEDPRTVHLRQELEALRLLQEKVAEDNERRTRDLTTRLMASEGEMHRLRQQSSDVAILNSRLKDVSTRLLERERELMELRQILEQERQKHAAEQQTLLTRLSELETSGNLRQAQEAKNVRLAPWMSFR